MAAPDYVRVDYREPHQERTRRILRDHPELRSLFGPTRISAVVVVAVVALQLGVAYLLQDAGWGWALAAAFFVGAFADHALWALIHECAHNLVFKSSAANTVLSIIANIPILFPSAVSFRKYHLLHHRFQGDLAYDADLPGPFEANLVRNIWWRKALWLFLFFIVQGTRVTRLKTVRFWDGWYVVNLVVQLLCVAGVAYAMNFQALAYLFLSSIFAIGLHPLGGRWIQEHYLTLDPKQETYSYYGVLNALSVNVGFHNEHHDLMRVPWTRLPKVRRIAHEYYDGLHAHRSWTMLWLRFIFDSRISLHSRVIRTSEVARAPKKVDGLAEAERLAGVGVLGQQQDSDVVSDAPVPGIAS